jgi:hypothetical protein
MPLWGGDTFQEAEHDSAGGGDGERDEENDVECCEWSGVRKCPTNPHTTAISESI